MMGGRERLMPALDEMRAEWLMGVCCMGSPWPTLAAGGQEIRTGTGSV